MQLIAVVKSAKSQGSPFSYFTQKMLQYNFQNLDYSLQQKYRLEKDYLKKLVRVVTNHFQFKLSSNEKFTKTTELLKSRRTLNMMLESYVVFLMQKNDLMVTNKKRLKLSNVD